MGCQSQKEQIFLLFLVFTSRTLPSVSWATLTRPLGAKMTSTLLESSHRDRAYLGYRPLLTSVSELRTLIHKTISQTAKTYSVNTKTCLLALIRQTESLEIGPMFRDFWEGEGCTPWCLVFLVLHRHWIPEWASTTDYCKFGQNQVGPWKMWGFDQQDSVKGTSMIDVKEFPVFVNLEMWIRWGRVCSFLP